MSARRRPNTFFWLVSSVLGLSLVCLGIPRTTAAWIEFAALPTIENLNNGRFPSDVEMVEAVTALRQAVAWVSSGPRLNMLGRLEFEQVMRLAPGDPKRTALLGDAERDLTEGLIAEPTDGFSWVRLAIIREQRGAPGRAIASALAQSLDVAPNARPIWLWRAQLLLKYSGSFTAEELPAVHHQLQTIWTTVPKMQMPLVRMARGNIVVLSKALEGDEMATDQLDRLQEEIASRPSLNLFRVPPR